MIKMTSHRMKVIAKAILCNAGFKVERPATANEVRKFIRRFSQMYVNTKLMRAGGEQDGGYLVPPVLDTCEVCFSPGVGPTIEFEKWVIEHYPMQCFLADASVSKTPFDHELIDFEKKFIGSSNTHDHLRMKSWVDSKTFKTSQNLLLQMDIEGGEYAVLSRESAEFWNRFNVIIVEFHFLENLFDRIFLEMFSSSMEKLYENFRIVHLHPNNYDYEVNLKGIKIPRVLEVTFLNINLLEKHLLSEEIQLPNTLDRPNVSTKSDIILDPIWYQ